MLVVELRKSALQHHPVERANLHPGSELLLLLVMGMLVVELRALQHLRVERVGLHLRSELPPLLVVGMVGMVVVG